ncbi:hypothetical protein GGR52DRAFT_562347 [Hypoxylon sp. FL1284]|nr:hypothetical protein GGR52DRAFT_562347 [Hypoxylon sp. FL1284]
MDSPPSETTVVEASNHENDVAAPSPQILDNRDVAEPTAALTSDPPPDTRRCFVCLTDVPEAALPPDWCTPCTCTLEGHQQCLLEWVADLEMQGKEIKCSICKSPITVTERLDSAVQFSNYLNDRFSEWSPKILSGFIASGALVSSSIYGAKAIDWFAGPDALTNFLLSSNDVAVLVAARREGREFDTNHELPVNLPHMAVLPFIAPALVLNRLRLGEVILIPVSILYTILLEQSDADIAWPPTSQRALSLYPVIQATYRHMHSTLSTSLERRWKAQAQKLLPQEATEQPLGVETGSEGRPEAHPEGHIEPPLDDEDRQLADWLNTQIGEEANNVGVVNPRGRTPDVFGPLFNFLAGTLMWPGVCYGAGELLRLALPSRFVSRPASGPSTGILQQRWGRSLVGGCLFVVLKDAFFLWIKYRKTMNRATRHIKNGRSRNSRR